MSKTDSKMESRFRNRGSGVVSAAVTVLGTEEVMVAHMPQGMDRPNIYLVNNYLGNRLVTFTVSYF